MNATRMIEIAIELKSLYEERALHSLNEWQADKDAEQRAILLTPVDGWPGKNQEQREAARAQALAADPAYVQCVNDQQAAHRATVEIEARIEGLLAERRALEFAVRSALVEALNDRGVPSNHRGEPVNHAFEDVQDWEAIERLDAQAYEHYIGNQEPLYYEDIAAPDNDIPF